MLYQNSPNPFIDTTKIRFDQAMDGPTVLKIYDLRGREVAKLVDAVLKESEHNTTWNGFDDTGKNVSAGIYLVYLKVPDGVHTIKLLRLK
jgi:flagellar hook assembly protein FlgD